MRQIILTLSIATLGLTAPAFAAEDASPPRVCGVRDEPAEIRTAAVAKRAAEVLAEFGDKAPEVDSSGASGFREPNHKLFLASLDDKQRCAVTPDGRCKWGVAKPFTYQVRGTQDVITIPPGFTTDLASIPSFAWPLLPPDGPWLKAAVVHDFLYKTCGRGLWEHDAYAFTRKTCTPDKPCYSRKEADGILRDAMEDRGVGPTKRGLIYTAVRWFGGGAWGR